MAAQTESRHLGDSWTVIITVTLIHIICVAISISCLRLSGVCLCICGFPLVSSSIQRHAVRLTDDSKVLIGRIVRWVNGLSPCVALILTGNLSRVYPFSHAVRTTTAHYPLSVQLKPAVLLQNLTCVKTIRTIFVSVSFLIPAPVFLLK